MPIGTQGKSPLIQIASLHIYPIKSCGPTRLDRMAVDARGPVDDRRLMIVDNDGIFITQRTEPRLALVHVARNGNRLMLEAPKKSSLSTTIEHGAMRPIEVWRHRGPAHQASPQGSAWLSEFLKREVTLVACPDDMDRIANPDWAVATTPVSFVDGYPILILSEESVAELNRRLDTPVDVMRFRPNIVLRGCPPFAEDRWKTLRIGNTIVDVLKPCDRCSVITIDPQTAASGKEPLTTLATFRKSPAGILFGQNGATREPALLETGAEVEVLAERPPEELPPEFRLP